MVWMKRFMSWNEKLKPPLNGQCRNDVVCFACREPGNLTWNCPHKQRGNRALGLPKGHAVPFILEAVAQASAIVSNEITNPVFVNNNTFSNIRLSNLCHRNHSVNCILLDTSATGSVLNEGTWRKRGFESKLKRVTGTLTIANRNELTVLEETDVSFPLEVFIVCAGPIPRPLILGSDIFPHFKFQTRYDTGTSHQMLQGYTWCL